MNQPSTQSRAIRGWKYYVNQLIAAEISAISRYYDHLFQWAPRAEDTGILFHLIKNKAKKVAKSDQELPDLQDEADKRSLILLNGNLNHDLDIQETLSGLKHKLSRTSRIVVVAYNAYLWWVYGLANLFGLRKGERPSTFITKSALSNLAKLSGYEIVSVRPVVHFPFKLFILGNWINHVLAAVPGFRWLSLAAIVVLRPIVPQKHKPSLSIIIPARNEKGNIENALVRIPKLEGVKLEVVFVEGHSSDGTREEIERLIPLYSQRFPIKLFIQSGKGKSDAVRLGFQEASSEILVILDADLTVPPELLERFYTAYCSGVGDFISGNRLLYPMEDAAMRFLNRLGNLFFAKALSSVLAIRIGDSLCGTKLLARHDYQRMCAWRKDFGDFDPFGDFELLFPASVLSLGVAEIPVRYLGRTYGSTNIHRFYHGWLLLKMTLTGFFRIKMGHVPK